MNKIFAALTVCGICTSYAGMAAGADLTRLVPNNKCYAVKGDMYTENASQRSEWPEKCDYRVFFYNDVDTVAPVPDASCVTEVANKINEEADRLSGDEVMYIMGLADSRGHDKYNIDLANRRVNNFIALLDADKFDQQNKNIEYFVAGESDDMASYGGDGRTSHPWSRAVCVIIGRRSGDGGTVVTPPNGFVRLMDINVTRNITTTATVTIQGKTADESRARIKNLVANLRAAADSLGDGSVWKNKEGGFNSARLVSDSVAGVVLGTAGGLITSHVIKKNQIKGGFEDISCTVGGQVVAGYADDFVVGVQ